jgi:predicted transcriptional regulator
MISTFSSPKRRMPSLAIVSKQVLVENPALISLYLPLTALVGITERRKIITCTQKIQQQQSLSDYTQQDLSVVTEKP